MDGAHIINGRLGARVIEVFQIFGTQARISHDAFQDLRVENFRGVKWNGGPFAFGILVDHVAAALARD